METDVAIIAMNFEPANITVRVGDTVKWTAQVDGHSTTSDKWNSGIMSKGSTFSFNFTFPGTYHYHCSNHPMMKGAVTVSPRLP